MRVILFTGKGGVGKTSVAAATAALTAKNGQKTLVVSTDTAHSLGDAFGWHIGAEPTEVATNLYVHQVDTQRAIERSWSEVQDYARDVLAELGIDPVTAEEVTVLPGAEEVLALLELREQVRSGRWDVVVVDCAPTAETLRLLALPEALNWHVERLLPLGRRLAWALRPLVKKVAHVSTPDNEVLNAGERFHQQLLDVRDILTDQMTSVRLVLTPESVVVAEARRTLTSLCLYGYRVDTVIANRVFPAEGADEWRAGWVEAQRERMAEIEESFAPLPIRPVPYLPREPVGLAELTAFADRLYGEADPAAAVLTEEPLKIEADGDDFELRLTLPFTERGDVDLARKGDELIITAGPYRRVLALPAALTRRSVGGATLRNGVLRVRFLKEADS